jgi:Tfp pilus assembly protein PilV
MSLLEVLTALAIFMLSVVVISQMVDAAAQTAQRAQRLSRAGLYAESKMAELIAGIEPLQNTSGQMLEEGGPGWTYSVQVEPESWTQVDLEGTQVAGLNLVSVTVAFNNGRAMQAVEQTLTRVVLDPRLRVPATAPTISTSTSTGTGTTTGQ